MAQWRIQATAKMNFWGVLVRTAERGGVPERKHWILLESPHSDGETTRSHESTGLLYRPEGGRAGGGAKEASGAY